MSEIDEKYVARTISKWNDAERAAARKFFESPLPGERFLAGCIRTMVEDLGIAPSGTGSEDLGIIQLELERLKARVAELEYERGATCNKPYGHAGHTQDGGCER